MSTPITEVSAPSGRRRWVYGRLDPGRPIEINMFAEPVISPGVFDFLAFVDSCLGFPIFTNPSLKHGYFVDPQNPKGGCAIKNVENSSTLSVDRRITAAEYRAQGIL